MTTFADSSVWFSAVFATDARHAPATRMLSQSMPLITSDHVIVESWLLLNNRFSQAVAKQFCRRIIAGWCQIEIATFEDRQSAETVRDAFPDQKFSLVDRTTFVIMERLSIARVTSFDDDFLIYRYGPDRRRAFEVLR